MESCSNVFHTKGHRRHSKKLMTVYTELTNLDPSLETGLEDLVITGWRWSLTPSSMLNDAMPVRSTVTLSIKHQDIFIQHSLHGPLRYGEWMLSVLSALQHRGHRFILAITDYFSKWAKVVPLKEIKTPNISKFIKHHVLNHFGVPWRIIRDNRPQFISQAFQKFYNKFRIQSVSSMTYYPAGNGLAVAFNKTIGKLLKKSVSKSNRNWDDKLGEYL